MRYNTGVSTITNAETNLMTVDPDKAAKVAAMLVNNYTSYVTPVREVIVNGLEAVAGNKDGKVVVDFDTNSVMEQSVFSNDANEGSGSYVISITDNGCGMSHDFAKNKFVHLTASSKDTTDSTIGGFGIGAKSVSSISHHTVFRTVQDGIATVIVFGMSDKGATTSVSDPMEVDEPNGTSVSIHVENDVFYSIMDNIEDQFLDYLDPDTPLEVTSTLKSFTIGSKAKNIVYSHTSSDGTTVHLVEHEDINHSFPFRLVDRNSTKTKHVIRCVGMPYPMIDSFNDGLFHDIVSKAVDKVIPGAYVNVNMLSIIVDVQPKDITIDSSRERVADTNHLHDIIRNASREAMTSYAENIKDSLVSAKDGEEFLSLIKKDFGCITFERGVLRDTLDFADLYQELSEDSDSDDTGILVIEDDSNTYYYRRMEPLDKGSIGKLFNAYRAPSIYNTLNNASDIDEALGIDTSGCAFIVMDNNNRHHKVIIGSNGLGSCLPKTFVSRFNDGDEISLPVEIVKWRFGVETTHADKPYSKIRRSMMARGRTSGKGAKSAKDRELFFYLDEQDKIQTATAGGAKALFDKWEKDGITTAVVMRDNNEDAMKYDTHYARSLNHAVKTMHGNDHAIVFVVARRVDTANKNQRIIEKKLEDTNISLDSDMLKDQKLYDASLRMIDNLSENIGYLFFETGLDSPEHGSHRRSGYDLGIGHNALDIACGDGTVQDALVDFLLLDKDKYALQRKKISEIADIHNDMMKRSASVDTINTRQFLSAFQTFHLAYMDNVEKTNDMLRDGADWAQHGERAKVLREVSKVIAEKRSSRYDDWDIEEAFATLFTSAQEIVDNPDSALATLIMS